MLVENSIVVADFIRGIYNPLWALCLIDIFACIIALIGFLANEGDSPICVWIWSLSAPFLMFCLWFFNTFTLK